MFGIGSFEFLVILLVGLVVLGPDKLPKVMRTFTKVMSEFRRIRTDFQRAVNTELAFQEQRELKKEAETKLLKDDAGPEAAPPVPSVPSAPDTPQTSEDAPQAYPETYSEAYPEETRPEAGAASATAPSAAEKAGPAPGQAENSAFADAVTPAGQAGENTQSDPSRSAPSQKESAAAASADLSGDGADEPSAARERTLS